MRAVLVALVLCVLCPRSPLAQGFDQVVIQTQSLADGLHMLTGRGGNLVVSSGADGVFLVDDQFAPLSERILAAIAKISSQPLRFVVNTHWHGDHTGGNENMGRAGALIVAHDNVRRRMSADQFQAAFQRTVPAAPPAALPVITFGEDVTFHLNGGEVHVFHVARAHTDGDAIVHFRAGNSIHMGDTFFNGLYPFIDLDSGGSIDGVIAAVDRALPLTDKKTRVIPGHGPLSDRAGLEAYRHVLVTVRDRVQAALGRGEGLDQVLASRPGREFDDTWGAGFIDPERFVRIVYASLRGR